ncbi:MAG: glutamate-1-semialdehyde-2,1-aminomutase [Candidatus Glassbacteria bacterium RIFCSPLOWO2_12_FULL_58_11]|uniref:Glutamate-1-semialdehyde 2,1-aminomutase n=1 Tax=Candidatus Glassbacteria bacterium RIFCSPLOWO2_12_FULL_58_11 TaxID=1817867 RepID=A0A1F5YZW7_9BACT|nr:MAG: glutamate-1-semialdehyde-2,1-aminomutase [Candidatus Glassbacteria bacterium RIFCSPLOWO2_12_FULL_58_11]
MGALSRKLYERACRSIPAGVNSPVRAFRSVGQTGPFFVERGEGAWLYDVEGNRYLDFVGSWGPLILGHNPPGLAEVLEQAIRRGTSYGAATEKEIELAELIIRMVPSIEMVRLVNSGTEATMSALRLARGFTGRDRIVKCEGCYHGHGDAFLVKAGSGGATFGVPDSAGVPREVSGLTINVPYNDLVALGEVFKNAGEQIAAVILEPVAGNMGVVAPLEGYLEGVRKITAKWGALLIFDEVITGFRLAPGGAQQRFGITPDLTCLGKIIGGGFPVGAFGGRREIMEKLAPLGPVYQAGTLSGNPVGVSAGLFMLRRLSQEPPYEYLESLSARLEQGIRGNLAALELELTANRAGSLLTLFFTKGPVVDFTSAKTSDTAAFGRYFHQMLSRGVFIAPSQYEAGFINAAMTVEDIDRTVEINREALKSSQP